MPPKRALLDVDPTIVERNLMITDSHDDELQHLFPPTKDEYPSKLVKPTPGFCVKTRSDSNEKIFINICQTDAIPAPNDISEGQLLEILQSETPEQFRVPMSIGEGRPETDKSGNAATAYDIAINPLFFEKIESNAVFKQFFLTAVLEGLEDKYSIIINRNEFTILKNRKAMGNLQVHRIQQREIDRKMNREKKLIEELDVPTTSLVTEVRKKSSTGGHSSSENYPKEPPYRLLKVYNNENQPFLIGDFYVPDIVSVKDVTLDVGEDRLILESRKRNYLVDIFIPHLITQNEVYAKQNTNSGILTITMPILQTA